MLYRAEGMRACAGGGPCVYVCMCVCGILSLVFRLAHHVYGERSIQVVLYDGWMMFYPLVAFALRCLWDGDCCHWFAQNRLQAVVGIDEGPQNMRRCAEVLMFRVMHGNSTEL